MIVIWSKATMKHLVKLCIDYYNMHLTDLNLNLNAMQIKKTVNEIISDIFSHVDLITLRMSVPLVCRRFHAIIQDALTKGSARPLSKAVLHGIDLGGFKLHSVFNHLIVGTERTGGLADTLGIRSPTTGKFVPISRTVFAKELPATPPAIQHGLFINLKRWDFDPLEDHPVWNWIPGAGVNLETLADKMRGLINDDIWRRNVRKDERRVQPMLTVDKEQIYLTIDARYLSNYGLPLGGYGGTITLPIDHMVEYKPRPWYH